MRQFLKRLTAALLSISLSLSLMAVPALAETTGTIIGDGVRVHEGTSGSETDLLLQLYKDDKVTILEDDGEWIKVACQDDDGNWFDGYISQDYVSFPGHELEAQEEVAEPAEETPAPAAEPAAEASTPAEEPAAPAAEPAAEASTPAEPATPAAESAESEVAVGEETLPEESTEEASSSAEETAPPAETPAASSEAAPETPAELPAEAEETEAPAEVESEVSYTASVNSDGINVRKQPNTDSKILISLPEGSIVTVLTENDDNDWVKVRYYDEEGTKYKGYMDSQYLDINAIASGKVKVLSAIVRESPDSSAEIVGTLQKDQKVDIYASANGWYKVEGRRVSGYVTASCIATESDSDCIGYGTVTRDELNLRESATKDSDALTTIPEGTTFQILSKDEDGWYSATYNGQSGYVMAKYVDFSETCESGYIQVTSSSLNLRAGASTDFVTLDNIPNGKVMKVRGTSGSWYKVKFGNYTGYVSGSFVSATGKDGFQNYPDYAQITASSLALRERATTDSDKLDTLPEGAALQILGTSNGWYKVSYNDVIGYIDASYTERSTAEAAEATAEAAQAATSGSGSSVLDFASQYVGNPYVWGGSSLTNGADCSGFVMSVFAQFGVSLPHSSAADRGVGTGVSVSEMQPGDIVCYSGHVGIYAGDGQLLSALGKKYGITYCSVNYKKILAVRRVL